MQLIEFILSSFVFFVSPKLRFLRLFSRTSGKGGEMEKMTLNFNLASKCQDHKYENWISFFVQNTFDFHSIYLA